MPTYAYPTYPSPPAPELTTPSCAGALYPVAIVGAGPVGLTLALDLAQRGVPTVVFDEEDSVSYGSRSVCQSKRSLEIWDRLGAAQPMLDKGVTWSRGHVFSGDAPVYSFDLQTEPHHKMPPFVNLQQYYVEQFLVERCLATPAIDLRFRNKVVGVRPGNDRVGLDIETPHGNYAVQASWVVACDGVRSPIRRMLGLSFEGEVFADQFLIADIVTKADWPAERRFWFDPPWHRGWSALMHKQADDVWRIDWQLGRELDPKEETKPENVARRLRAMFGDDLAFEFEWISMYTFTCRTMERYAHARIVFAGDSAHVVSPFGARGGNAGVADADNLGWKLALVAKDEAGPRLIDSYASERKQAALENIRQSTRSTDFITPKHDAARLFREQLLGLARELPFARAMINSGRLSTANAYDGSPLSAPDVEPAGSWGRAPAPGAPAPDAPLLASEGEGWLNDRFGLWFAVLAFAGRASEAAAAPWAGAAALSVAGRPVAPLLVVDEDDGGAPPGWRVLRDPTGTLRARYDGRPGTLFLVRPDRHVAGRWREPTALQVGGALKAMLQ